MIKFVGLFLGLIFCLFTQDVFAHPPVRIDVSYDAPTKTVTAVIVHPVANPKSHYIEKVDVSVNGKEVEDKIFSSQENASEQTVSYELKDVKSGDVIGIEGYCNISGKKENTIIVQ